MKRWSEIICAFAVAGLLSLPAQEKRPSIRFDSIEKDFGKAREGQTLRHVFRFTNNGNATLEILGVEASCGCTSALLSDKKVAPGRGGEIEVNIATENLSTLEISKTVTVISNDPKQPQVILSLRAELVPEFTLSEPSVYFGSVPRGKEVIKEILVTIPDDISVQLLAATSTDQNVLVKLEAVADSNGRKFRIVAIRKSDAAEGYHFGNIVVKTTSKLKPELKISVRGIVTKGGPAASRPTREDDTG